MSYTGLTNPIGTYSFSGTNWQVSTNVTLDPQPSVSASSSASSGSGISSFSSLSYSFAYFTSQTTPIQILLSTKTLLNVGAATTGIYNDSTAQATSHLFINGLFNGYECSIASALGKPDNGACDTTGYASIQDTILSITPNSFYGVQMSVSAGVGASTDGSAVASAWLDPIFTVVGQAPSDGFFVFSQGIGNSSSSVPEPETAALVLSGLAALQLIIRKRKS